MIRLEQEDKCYAVYRDAQRVGMVELYDNPYHMKNCYVKLELERLDVGIGAELFHTLREIMGRPLQVMVSSDDTVLTDFLIAAGFECRRKCYDVEAGAEEYIGGESDVRLLHSHTGELNYGRCCQLMFDYYVKVHKAVNPWTADYETFCQNMPADVAYARLNGEITSLAFTEDNEIAYVCGTDKQHFADFVCSLVTAMFKKYKTICFESDDCDWVAMQLRSTFENQDETSFDTYVYDNERTIS